MLFSSSNLGGVDLPDPVIGESAGIYATLHVIDNHRSNFTVALQLSNHLGEPFSHQMGFDLPTNDILAISTINFDGGPFPYVFPRNMSQKCHAAGPPRWCCLRDNATEQHKIADVSNFYPRLLDEDVQRVRVGLKMGRVRVKMGDASQLGGKAPILKGRGKVSRRKQDAGLERTIEIETTPAIVELVD